MSVYNDRRLWVNPATNQSHEFLRDLDFVQRRRRPHQRNPSHDLGRKGRQAESSLARPIIDGSCDQLWLGITWTWSQVSLVFLHCTAGALEQSLDATFSGIVEEIGSNIETSGMVCGP